VCQSVNELQSAQTVSSGCRSEVPHECQLGCRSARNGNLDVHFADGGEQATSCQTAQQATQQRHLHATGIRCGGWCVSGHATGLQQNVFDVRLKPLTGRGGLLLLCEDTHTNMQTAGTHR